MLFFKDKPKVVNSPKVNVEKTFEKKNSMKVETVPKVDEDKSIANPLTVTIQMKNELTEDKFQVEAKVINDYLFIQHKMKLL